jgi:tetratricopeptide (TPR) repeat protein
MALGILGRALQGARQLDEAITAHQDAAAIFRQTSDRHSEGMALEGLGTALQETGQYDEAMTAYQGALAIYQEADILSGQLLRVPSALVLGELLVRRYPWPQNAISSAFFSSRWKAAVPVPAGGAKLILKSL